MASPALSESLTERLSHLKPQAPAGLVIRADPLPQRLPHRTDSARVAGVACVLASY